MGSNTKHKKIIKSLCLERVSIKRVSWFHPRLFKEHEIRYGFVKKFVRNKIVLDIACGNGYGSNLLANSGAKFVYGIDYDKESIENANKKYMQENIKFVLGDAEKIPLGKSSVDTVVSLETLEHLRSPEKFITEISRVLKPRGMLILSTPNKEVSYEDNPFHLKEYTLSQLNSLLSDFRKKEFFGQRRVIRPIVWLYKLAYAHTPNVFPISLIKFFLRLRPWENQKIHKLKNLSDTSYMYFIIVCRS